MKILKIFSPSLFTRHLILTRNTFTNSGIKYFSTHHSNSHGDVEEDIHPKTFNRISYNKKLSGPERDKLSHLDYFNEKETDYLKTKNSLFLPKPRYEVLVPYKTRREDMEEVLLDRTEIQARIYNVLRMLDLKSLDEIDFDADYEKDLGFDSLEWTAIVTSIEHEFHTVFEDSFYEHHRTINDFVKIIENDFSCF